MRVACVQTQSTDDVDSNTANIISSIARAARDGADVVATPEMSLYLGADGASMLAFAQSRHLADAMQAIATAARDNGVWLLLGSVPWASEDSTDGKVYNRSLLYDCNGELAATYDKIHLFDAKPGDGTSYRESRRYRGGTRAVAVQTPLGKFGMTVCYDLRFSALYGKLAQMGCHAIFVPSAFTRPTGKAHWEVLLRARAIEFGCYVVAPAQCGVHADGRTTWGHSMIVDPWGKVLTEASEEPCIVSAEVDLTAVARARAAVPNLANRRRIEGGQ